MKWVRDFKFHSTYISHLFIRRIFRTASGEKLICMISPPSPYVKIYLDMKIIFTQIIVKVTATRCNWRRKKRRKKLCNLFMYSKFCMEMLELKLIFNPQFYHSEGTTATISSNPEENLLFIRNHRELISDKWATIGENRLLQLEYKWCYKCFGKSINLQWIERWNNKQHRRINWNWNQLINL